MGLLPLSSKVKVTPLIASVNESCEPVTVAAKGIGVWRLSVTEAPVTVYVTLTPLYKTVNWPVVEL